MGVYDQAVGRFLSADPLISEPLNTQNYNRYSYVYNNPLSAVDPSGFEAEDTDDRRHPWIEFSFASFFGSLDLSWFYQTSREQFLEKPDAASISPGIQVQPTMPNIDSAIAWSGRSVHAVGEILFPNVAAFGERGEIGSWADISIGAAKALANGAIGMARTTGAGALVPNYQIPITDEQTLGAAIVDVVGAFAFRRGVAEFKSVGSTTLETVERTVIGRISKDTGSVVGIRSGERALQLSDRGSNKANWSQNSGALRQTMSKGLPIRDAAVDPRTGELVEYPGSFLNAERGLLRQRGWTYDPKTTLWSPP